MSATRRQFLATGAGAALAGLLPDRAFAAASGRVVIVGGGFGGATAAQFLRRLAPGVSVTMVEPNENFVTCPFSNAVIGGLSDISSVTHSYDGLKRAGVTMVRDSVTAIDAERRNVRLAEAPSHGKSIIGYDRSSRGGIAYLGLAGEIVRNEKKKATEAAR